jgi:hypothetical protein
LAVTEITSDAQYKKSCLESKVCLTAFFQKKQDGFATEALLGFLENIKRIYNDKKKELSIVWVDSSKLGGKLLQELKVPTTNNIQLLVLNKSQYLTTTEAFSKNSVIKLIDGLSKKGVKYSKLASIEESVGKGHSEL